MKTKKMLVIGCVIGAISLSACEQGMLNPQPESQAEEMVKEEDKDVLATMPLSEMGEIELPDLEKLNIGEVYQAKADQSDVQRVIDQYLYENMKEVDEPAAENDYINVNVTGTVDGEANDRYTIQETTLKIGSGEILGNAEAENHLLGKKAGEDVSVEYVPTEETAIMPQDIGKTVSVTAHINWVGKVPELTDEFVSQQGEFTIVVSANNGKSPMAFFAIMILIRNRRQKNGRLSKPKSSSRGTDQTD
ncbi:hypothetical protein [[Clostridium] aminophilum]|uniref:hypothetical protein n=1 Tax=[Clostridium] aminophilum TaxID=1526 RepID=UPI0033238ABF